MYLTSIFIKTTQKTNIYARSFWKEQICTKSSTTILTNFNNVNKPATRSISAKASAEPVESVFARPKLPSNKGEIVYSKEEILKTKKLIEEGLQIARKKKEQLDGHLVFLTNESKNNLIVLVGTHHYSNKSAEQVYEIIHQYNPDTIMVELCRFRAAQCEEYKHLVTDEEAKQRFWKTVRRHPFLFVLDIWRELRARFKTQTFIEQNDVLYGMEMKVALDEAHRRKKTLVCGDIDFEETSRKSGRAVSKIGYDMMVTEKRHELQALRAEENQLTGNLTIQDMFEKQKDRERLRKFNAIYEEYLPELVQVMNHDRDKHMAEVLRNCEGTVVAVMGIAHLDGVQKYFNLMEEKK